jgi:hypothetical protein
LCLFRLVDVRVLFARRLHISTLDRVRFFNAGFSLQ